MKILKRFSKRTLSIFLAAVVLITTVGIGTFAQENEITQADDVLDTYDTTVYEALSEEEMEDYLLEEYPSITLEVEGADTEVDVKKWESDDYDPETAGTYTFTPTLKESGLSYFTTAEDVELPVVTVVLEKNTIRSIETDLSGAEYNLSEVENVSDLDLPEEIEVTIDLRTQEEYDTESDSSEEEAVLGEEEDEDTEEDADLVTITLAVEEWICDDFCLEEGEYTFTADLGDNFDDKYEWDSSLEGVQITVSLVADEVSEGSADEGIAAVSESDIATASESGIATIASDVADGEGYVTEINTFTAPLVSGATENSNGDLVWTATTNLAGHKFKFRVNFSISGESTLAAATVDSNGNVTDTSFEIRVPYQILKDKDGNYADTFYCAYPSIDELEDMDEDDLEEADGFAYYIDEDNNEVVIYNFKEISAAYSGYFEVSYETSKKTQYYYDYDGNNTQSYDDLIGTFYASISVEGKSNTLTDESDEIDVYIDTNTEISSVSKGSPSRYTSWQSSWGTEPSDIDASYYLVYCVTTRISAGTQYYDFTFTDSTMTYSATYSDGTTASGSLSDGGVNIVAYKLQGGSYTTRSKYTSLSVTKKNVAPSSSTQTRYDYIIVALSSDVFTDDLVSFTVTNTVSCTVDPVDGVESSTKASSTKSYSWTKPTWTTPSGHFNVFKYGNENNYFGDYISYALDTLQSEDVKTTDSISDIKYLVQSVGYAYPWTLMDDWSTTEGYYTTTSSSSYSYTSDDKTYTKTSTTKIPNYNAYGHNDVTYVITDDTLYPLYSDGTSINGVNMSRYTGEEDLDTYGQVSAYSKNGVDPLDPEDYDFSYLTWRITMKDAERDDNGDPIVDDDYDYELYTLSKSTYSDDDIITLYVKVDGSWLEAGEWSLKSSTWTAASEGGSYVASFTSSTVTFKGGVDGYRFIFSNAYYYSYMTIYAYVTLYATEDVQDWVGSESDGTAVESVILRNAVTMQVYYADEYAAATTSDEEDDALIIELTKVIGDRIRIPERDSYISKKLSVRSVSKTDKTYTLTWKISMYETIKYDTSKAYITQDSGTFYDLLPYGSTYSSGSVLVKNEEGYLDESEYEVEVIDNYADSGRTLLIVRILVEGDYYTLWFDNIYSYDSLDDIDDTVLNPVAYETGNDDIADGYADDATTVFSDDDNNAVYMTGLSSTNNGEETFIYSSASTSISIETSAATGLTKKVKSEDEDDYSYDTTVPSDGTYSYRLRYANTYTTQSKNMIFYDSLENYSDDDVGSSQWYGTLTAVDTSQLSLMGIDPVVYISTQRLDLSDEDNLDLTDTSIWTKVTSSTDLSTAKSVAIDMRYSDADSKTEFVLEEGESVAVVLYMKAPSEDTSGITDTYPETYNNVYMSLTYGTNVSSSSASADEVIYHNYTTVRYAVAGDVYLEKVSSEDSTEVISGITFVLSGTSDYGTEVYEELTTNRYGMISWTDIEKGTYTIQEINEYEDWLSDHNEYTVIIDDYGNVTVYDLKGNEYSATEDEPYVFENTPRIHADIEFTKTDYFTGYALGTGFTFYLYGTSDYGTEVNEYAESTSSGTISFTNIEMGTYTLIEIQSDDDHVCEEIYYTVKIDENGLVSIDGDNASISKNGSYLISDLPYQELTILKRSSYDNSAIEGVEFTLSGTSDIGNYYSQTVETNSNGSLTFTNLEPGTYTLIETSTENATVAVAADTSVRVVVVSNDGTITIDGEDLNSYHNYTIINTQIKTATISVIKKWVTENTSLLYDDDGDPIFPTIYISTKDPSYVDVTLDFGDYTEATLTINGTTYSHGDTISVKYGSTLESAISASSTEATNSAAYEFYGWYADSSLTTAYDTSSEITEDITIYAYIVGLTLKYAVSVYGIEEDTILDDDGSSTITAGLTFGPATGFSYVSQYASHTPTGKTDSGNEHRCIHDDTWEEIIYWSEEDPYVYEQCMTDGTNSEDGETGVSCTKAIEIDLNSTLANSTYVTDDESSSYYSYTHMSGDGCGTLYYALSSRYRVWNGYDSSGNYYSYGGWGYSQIRQVLNGSDTAGYSTYNSCWHTSSGTEFTEITSTTCLLSCFPEELQAAIASTQISYNLFTGGSKTSTCYDKLFLMSTIDMLNSSTTGEPDKTQYSRNSMLTDESLTYSYRESGAQCMIWTRSVYALSSYYYTYAYVIHSGSVGYGSVCAGYGIAPCFSLK